MKYQNGKYVEKIISFWFRTPCLSKMKELNQNILGKELFASVKRHLCLTKGHLDNPEGLVDIESA